MAGGGPSGIALAALGAGFVVLWSGVKGKSISQAVQYIIQGKNPSGSPAANPIAGSAGGAAPGNAAGAGGSIPSGGSAQAALQQAAAQHGWGSGSEWQSLQSLEMGEAGFNPQARNSGTGAFGLAQALGHGNANTAAPDGTNEYGGYGLSDAQAKAANSGDAGAQAVWMCNYIATTYGDPNNAWNTWQSRNPHWY